MKTFTLDVDYECDFTLFGLVSNTRDYTLAWTLNRALRLRLTKQPELLLNLLSRGRLVFTFTSTSPKPSAAACCATAPSRLPPSKNPSLPPISRSTTTCWP